MKNNSYLYQVNRVIDYINRNLDADLSLQVLAEIASFSPFHFHRIFKAIVGEKVHDFVSRLRVERAAVLLRHQPNLFITEIALQCGFSSTSTFSRAFKNYFGVNPSLYREDQNNSKNCKVVSKNSDESISLFPYDEVNKANDLIKTRKNRKRFQVKILVLPDFRVAYSRVLHGFNKGVFSERISTAFDRVYYWMEARELLTANTKTVGILYDHLDVTAPEKCRYDAGFSLEEAVQVNEGNIAIQEVVGGKYASITIENDNLHPFSFQEAITELGKAVDFLYGDWLISSFFQLEDKPCLEFYHTSRFDSKITLEFCLPVIPL
jgi:AraC family transcriptional regulator